MVNKKMKPRSWYCNEDDSNSSWMVCSYCGIMLDKNLDWNFCPSCGDVKDTKDKEENDIELVIKMPEKVYKSIINGKNYISYQEYVEESIKNGTSLPKGHGKIGDLDKLKQKIEMGDDDIMEEDWYKLYDNVISEIDNAYAIIEADKR